MVDYTVVSRSGLTFTRRTNLLIQESRENYFYNSATKEE